MTATATMNAPRTTSDQTAIAPKRPAVPRVVLIEDYQFTTSGDVPVTIRCRLSAVRNAKKRWTIMQFDIKQIAVSFDGKHNDDITQQSDYVYGFAKYRALQTFDEDLRASYVHFENLVAALDALEADDAKRGINRIPC